MSRCGVLNQQSDARLNEDKQRYNEQQEHKQRSTPLYSSAASDVYKRQVIDSAVGFDIKVHLFHDCAVRCLAQQSQKRKFTPKFLESHVRAPIL